MKKTFLIKCESASAILFLGFIGLYAYVFTANPNPISAIRTFPPYDGGNIHCELAKDVAEVNGPHLIFFNQKMPFWGVRAYPFSSADKIISKYGFKRFGIQFGSGTHSSKMLGCSDSDRTTEVEFTGYGIFFYEISHSIDKDKTWWTLMISLWYPIIIFAILLTIFLVRRLIRRQSSSLKP